MSRLPYFLVLGGLVWLSAAPVAAQDALQADSARARTGLYFTVDRFALNSTGGLDNDGLGGTVGYRFASGLDLGTGLHVQRDGLGGRVYTLGMTAGYTHAFTDRTGLRATGRLTTTLSNSYYDPSLDAAGVFAYTRGPREPRRFDANLDVAAYHRLALTDWLSITPSAGVFVSARQNVNRDAYAYGSALPGGGLYAGLHTGLDLTLRLSQNVEIVLPLRLWLFPQKLAGDAFAAPSYGPPFGTGLRINF